MTTYTISYQNPQRQFLDIEAEFETDGLSEINVHLPVWRPGRYEIQNFPKRIRSFKAFDSKENILSVEKTTKSTWNIQTKGEKRIKLVYEYYASEMDAGNTYLNDDQLYVNFINCMVYADHLRESPCQVLFDLPEDYELATGLDIIDKHKVEAASYNILVDSPLFASPTLRTISFNVREMDFYVHIQGDLPVGDDQLRDDFRRYTIKQMEVMGGFPTKHYHYLIQVLPYKHYHGVEHWNSTVITVGPASEFTQREKYLELLGVSSHELFHTWNVIRLRPKEMVPYNFSEENYHKTGFVTEGVTTYYGDLFLIRSGVFSLKEYFIELNKLLKRHFENEGRKHYSVAESSFDLWLDGYAKGIPGRKVSIYNEGALAAMILDLTIRLKFNHKKSLDDVIRLMFSRYGEQMFGYTFENYQEVAEEVFEGSLEDYFENIIHGTTPYENYLEPLFENVGLDFKINDSDKVEEQYFGFRLTNGVISQIDEGSPAELLLSIGDRIISIDGNSEWKEIPQEEKLNLSIERLGRKLDIVLEKSADKFFQVYVATIKSDITEKQKANLESWLEVKL